MPKNCSATAGACLPPRSAMPPLPEGPAAKRVCGWWGFSLAQSQRSHKLTWKVTGSFWKRSFLQKVHFQFQTAGPRAMTTVWPWTHFRRMYARRMDVLTNSAVYPCRAQAWEMFEKLDGKQAVEMLVGIPPHPTPHTPHPTPHTPHPTPHTPHPTPPHPTHPHPTPHPTPHTPHPTPHTPHPTPHTPRTNTTTIKEPASAPPTRVGQPLMSSTDATKTRAHQADRRRAFTGPVPRSGDYAGRPGRRRGQGLKSDPGRNPGQVDANWRVFFQQGHPPFLATEYCK